MGISASGITSGLDVNSLVSQLMAAESAPLNRLQAKEKSYNTKISAYGALTSALSSFQTSLTALSSSALSTLTATSSNTSILGVNAATNAAPGTYAIQVSKLAQAQKAGFPGQASATQDLGSGNMTVHIGGASIKVADAGHGNYSLTDLASAINTANAGVTATVINDGSSTPYRLILSANEIGKANAFTITADGDLNDFVSSANGMEEIQPAQDATIKIDNVLFTRPSNNITDAIPGVTLDLTKAAIGSTVDVTVARDKTAMKSAVNNFVSTYNALASKITELTAYDTTSKTASALNGDQAARSVMVALRKELSMAVSGSGSGVRMLSDIGVSFQRDGKLAADDTKLQNALDTKFNDVANLFASPTGYATRITEVTKNLLASDGIIANRKTGLQSTINSLKASEEALQVRLAATEKRIRAQYVALDSMLSGMQSTSSYLTQQLSALSKNN